MYPGGLTDIKGLIVGHDTDAEARTGCTVVVCPDGAVCAADVRGAAPGTRETDLLRGYNLVPRVHALLLTGGSAYGLGAAGGVMEWLLEKGVGFRSGDKIVPIVPAAVIYDLDAGENKHPDAEAGKRACMAASDVFAQGAVGAGTGATVCKIAEMKRGGLGSASMDVPGIGKIAALMVVNALGAIYDDEKGECLTPYGEMTGSPSAGCNTTIGVVATDAYITREQAYKLAQDAHDGLARSVRPAHTPFDGDTIFAMSTAEEAPLLAPAEFLRLLHAGAQVTSRAIANALFAVGAASCRP